MFLCFFGSSYRGSPPPNFKLARELGWSCVPLLGGILQHYPFDFFLYYPTLRANFRGTIGNMESTYTSQLLQSVSGFGAGKSGVDLSQEALGNAPNSGDTGQRAASTFSSFARLNPKAPPHCCRLPADSPRFPNAHPSFECERVCYLRSQHSRERVSGSFGGLG